MTPIKDSLYFVVSKYSDKNRLCLLGMTDSTNTFKPYSIYLMNSKPRDSAWFNDSVIVLFSLKEINTFNIGNRRLSNAIAKDKIKSKSVYIVFQPYKLNEEKN